MEHLRIEQVKVDKIKEYPNNPRKNDQAVEYVLNSIKDFGFQVPIILDSDNVIIAGHTRLKAAKELGMQEVPCIIADDLDEEQAKALRLADNKVAEFSVWDYEKLWSELDTVLTVDMSAYGFDGGLKDLDFFIDDELSDFYDSEDFAYNMFGVSLTLPTEERAAVKEYLKTNTMDELAAKLLEYMKGAENGDNI